MTGTKHLDEYGQAIPRSTVVSALAAAFIVATPVWLATRGVSYVFPDYGDLWRWAALFHDDKELVATELLSETNLLGHNQVLTIWLSELAATRYDYSLLWGIGLIGVALTAVAIALLVNHSLLHLGIQPIVAGSTGLVIAPLAFRHDVASAYFSSLLVFEQLFYFFSLAALLLGGRQQAKAVAGHQVGWASYLGLAVLLLMGEAPSAVSSLALLGIALIMAIAGKQHRHLVGVFAAIAGSVAAKWLLRSALGGRGTGSHDSALTLLDPRNIPDWLTLLGSSVRRLSIESGTPAPSGWYLALGTLIFAFFVLGLAYAIFYALSAAPDIHQMTLLFAGLLLVGFGTVAAMTIVDLRPTELNGRYDTNRFVRSTQFTPAGVMLIVLGLPIIRHLKTRTLVVAAGASLLLLARVTPALDVRDTAHDMRSISANNAAMVCQPPDGEIPWKSLWLNFSPENSAAFEQSQLFTEWKEHRCPVRTG